MAKTQLHSPRTRRSKEVIRPTLDWEHRFGYPQRKLAGVDEVGRGCLAGPVVAASVILPEGDLPEFTRGVTDSKKLSEAERKRLAPLIREWVQAHSVGWASAAEIDALNIHHASHLAMVRAVQGLAHQPDWILVDGKFLPQEFHSRASAIIQGDLHSLSIACASILAKVYRDEWMERLGLEYPGYDFVVHKGYPTPRHKKAIRELGASKEHRLSFRLA